MQLASNLSDPALCYSERMLHNTRVPSTKVLGIGTGPNLISLNQGPRTVSELHGLSAVSCMCPVSGTKTHKLSSLYPSPSHPLLWFLRDSPWIQMGKRTRSQGTTKTALVPSRKSFACPPNYKEGNQNTIICSKSLFQYHYPLHYRVSKHQKVFAVFILSINERCKATELQLWLLWTTVILQNHTAFSPILIWE